MCRRGEHVDLPRKRRHPLEASYDPRLDALSLVGAGRTPRRPARRDAVELG
jgi:hypothetical protein